jgi:hypothetical protein
MKIDIALICGRRPELLEQTLSSFHERVFKNFDVAQCYANIDPFCGDAQDAVRCRSIILDYFPGAEITIPNEASFGRAVQTTWARVQSPVVLHLEDDWVVLEEIFPHHVFPVLSGSTMALQLMHKGLKWNGRDLFREVVRKRKIWGITVSRVRASVFGTAPAFFSGPFLRQCAALMRSDLDPEKQ